MKIFFVKWMVFVSVIITCFLATNTYAALQVKNDSEGAYVFVNAEGEDDAGEISAALALAAEKKIKRIKLAPGDYMLTAVQTVMTKAGRRNVHVPIIDVGGEFDGFTFEGSVGEDGIPTTKLIAHNNPNDRSKAMGDLMWVQDCSNFTIKNIIFDRNPKFTVAGKIIEVKTSETVQSQNYIRVKYYDHDRNVPFTGMQFACANLFDLSKCPNEGEDGLNVDLSNAILTDRSLTFATPSVPIAKVEVENEKDKIVKITYTGTNLTSDTDNFARRCEEGQGISWAYDASGALQVDFYMCDDLNMINLTTYSASSMALQTHTCRNVTGDGVKFYPEPGSKQFMVCGRDAWKTFKCSGTVKSINGWQEGVRMDGQNTHGIWLVVYEKVDDKTIDFLIPSGNGVGCYLTKGDVIEFQSRLGKQTLIVESVDPNIALPQFMIDNKDQGGSYYMWRITFQSQIPDFVEVITRWKSQNGETIKYHTTQIFSETMFAEVLNWNIDEFIIENTTFKNIAGYGPMIKCDNATVTNCSFINMQNGGIFVGTEFPESGFPKNVEISGNLFDNCGWANRENYYYKGAGPKAGAAIVITPMVSYTGDKMFKEIGFIKNITITNNTFINNITAVRAYGVNGIMISDNKVARMKNNLLKDGYSICHSDDQDINENDFYFDSYCKNIKNEKNIIIKGKDEIVVIVDKSIVIFDQNPVIENGRTLVPMRAIAEEMGAKVSWDESSETVDIEKNGTNVKLIIGGAAYVDRKLTAIDVPAQIINERTLVPVRFLSEAFGAKVDWDEDEQIIRIEG